MRRVVAGLVLGILAASPWSVVAAGDGPPSATPPAFEAPIELPKVIESTPIQDNRPILVIPGVTTPRLRQRPAAPTTPRPVSPSVTAPSAAPEPSDGLPPLMGPVEMPRAEPLRGLPADQPVTTSRSPRIPLTLESIPGDSDDGPDGEPGSPRRSSSEPRSGSSSTPAPRRPPGLLNRVFPFGTSGRGASNAREGVTVEPKSDPASDAAAKRRIERQVRESLGSRLRSFDVRVVGREVTVQARTTRFWQRRGVRSALESLPALSGYKTNIRVDE